MRIDRMTEGKLYKIKPKIQLYSDQRTGPNRDIRVLGGYKSVMTKDRSENLPPFVYLGFKKEDWAYHYQHTTKIHYILWEGDIWVMDNQFAKHIVPLWDGDENGED